MWCVLSVVFSCVFVSKNLLFLVVSFFRYFRYVYSVFVCFISDFFLLLYVCLLINGVKIFCSFFGIILISFCWVIFLIVLYFWVICELKYFIGVGRLLVSISEVLWYIVSKVICLVLILLLNFWFLIVVSVWVIIVICKLCLDIFFVCMLCMSG